MSSESGFRSIWLSYADKDNDPLIDKEILINRNGIWIKDKNLIQNAGKKVKDRANSISQLNKKKREFNEQIRQIEEDQRTIQNEENLFNESDEIRMINELNGEEIDKRTENTNEQQLSINESSNGVRSRKRARLNYNEVNEDESISSINEQNLDEDRSTNKKENYECELCFKKYSCLGNLTVHKRIHTNEKPFKCDQCNYSSNDKWSLTRHKRIHSNEKPFKCDQCIYESINSSNLKIHVIKHHK